MSSSPPTKDIANTVYHAAVTTALAVLYSMFGKKIMRLDVGDPARPDFTEYIKLSGVITLAMFTKDWLVNRQFIPDDIIKS